MQHPIVAAGLQTLLDLEHRYDTKRVGRLSEAASLARVWRPGIALVDGMLLREREHPALGVPAIVLTGSVLDWEGLQRALDDPRGWLRKDPPPVAAIAGTGVMLFLAWGLLALRAAG